MRTENSLWNGDRVLFGGHRGDRAGYPENTMPAFRSAYTLGCEVIETDVRMTADGHLVLIHDRSVARTTDGVGLVDEMTLEELRRLDAGTWKGAEFCGERIPTVEEFLEWIAPTGMLVNWELKEYPGELGDRAFLCADRLAELIERYGMTERSVMNSFSEQILEHYAVKYPNRFVLHGYLHYKHPKDFAASPLASFLHWAAIWRKDGEHPCGFETDYAEVREQELLPCILVPDTAEMYAEALRLGCRMFTSDDPARGLAALRELGVHE